MKTKILSIAVVFFTTNVALLKAQMPNYTPSTGVVAWYEFSGNANDLSGNNLTGSVNGASLTTDRFNQSNSAYDFNGSNNDVVLGTNALLNLYKSFTIAGWFNSVSNNTIQGIVCREGAGIPQTPWLVRLSSQKLTLWLGNGSNFTEFSSHQSYQSNEWYHFSVSYDSLSGNVKMYINGELDLDTTTTQTCFSYSNVITKIGKQFNNNFPFSGKLDDIGLWNRMLSQQEVMNLYHAGLCYQNTSVTDTLFVNWGLSGFAPIMYKNNIKIYPNPAQQKIMIENSNYQNLGNYSIKICNVAGVEVFNSNINQQLFQLDVTTWTGAGLYFVKIINATGSVIETRKIVLQ